MGPLRSKQAKEKVLSYIETGLKEGAKLILDGRNIKVEGHENGYFIGPTIFDQADPKMKIGSEEIFGPVMCIMRAKDLDESLQMIHQNPHGNAAHRCLLRPRYWHQPSIVGLHSRTRNS
jgi:malonate-semialdehyde dehydrogenase (acetylating)/methylmalonate-semialdehyde dehydrogenase